MKKRIFKRMLAVILTICITLSTVTFSVSAGSFTNFGINKLYTTGFLVAGKALTSVAGATGCEEFEKIASFINVWVCGGNSTTQTLGEIQALCEEILAEVKKIEQKQDSYASYFSSQQAQDKYDMLVKEMNKVWDDDVEAVLRKNGINIAMLDFFEYEDLIPVSDTDTNQHIGYVAASNCYKTDTPDKYGDYYTFDDVQKLREDLFNDFCLIHGNMPAEADTIRKKADILFSSTVVDENFQEAIRTLSNNINEADSYSDICAQVAYQSMPNLADQYEFVMTGMNKHFMEVIMVEMLYQEYLSMRGEYLEKCYPDYDPEDKAKWTVYNSNVAELEKCNEELLGIIENRVSKPLQLSTNIKLSIDKYVRPEDVTGITLKNTEYKSRRDAYDYSWVDYYSPNMTDAKHTKEYMDFVEIAVPTSSGVKLFHMFDGDAESLKTKNLVHKFSGSAGIDWYGATCDAYNFRHCTYSDGLNNFSNPVDPSGDAILFQTDSFALYGSTPYNYLSQYIDYVPSDKRIYRMYAKSFNDTQADGWLTDDHMIFDSLDMKDSYVGFDTSLGLVEKIDAKVVYEKDYNRKGYDKASYDSYFNVILTQDSNEIKHKLSYSVTGSGNADMYITKSDGTKVSSGEALTSGENLTLWLKTVDGSVYMDSLNMSKYNDYQNPNTPTSTQTLLGQDEIRDLELDEATGYYKVDFTMPYSDTKLELTTANLPNSLDNKNGSYVISSYDDLCQMSKMVNSRYSDYVNGCYVLANDIDCTGKTWTSIGNETAKFNGTLNGNGYTIHNLNRSSGTEDGNRHPLFNVLEESAVVKNVIFTGADVFSAESPVKGSGVVCKQNEGTIENCMVKDSNVQLGNWLYLGGIAGLNNGTIENCGVVNTSITRRWGASTTGTMGGISETNNGNIKNCYTYNCRFNNGVAENNSPITASGKAPENCYFYTTSSVNKTNGTEQTPEQFNSGEVTYLLNKGVTDGTQAWYQTLGADDYPVLDNTHGTVCKMDDTYVNGDLIGDMNLDGVIDETDLTLLGEYLVRKAVLTADEVTLGDVNGDGKTDPNDLAIMKAYVNQDGTDYANTGKYGINTMPTDVLLVGDVNFDGVIDQSDADLISQFNVEMTELTDEQKKAGDIDLDGHLSSKDMAEINKYIAIVSSGKVYTGNIGKYSYYGFDMTITGGHTSIAPTVPKPDNSDADSSTSDSVNKNDSTINTGKTDNGTVQTGNNVSYVILLIVSLSGLVLVFTLRKSKTNK